LFLIFLWYSLQL